ncbi:hypothetical protein ACFWWM_26905 [Streptomyces sp. NPDC058682]|uniref:hypothetical protein n=1 Tax=Streptomyces sp. NPDC058682 TaxID=3346596 RepID=UPI003653A045
MFDTFKHIDELPKGTGVGTVGTAVLAAEVENLVERHRRKVNAGVYEVAVQSERGGTDLLGRARFGQVADQVDAVIEDPSLRSDSQGHEGSRVRPGRHFDHVAPQVRAASGHYPGRARPA